MMIGEPRIHWARVFAVIGTKTGPLLPSWILNVTSVIREGQHIGSEVA
jgi:hypothetical protein